MITIINNGPAIVSTNYWQTEQANTGMCYLSGNAGALRLLVPEAAEGLLQEMRTGTHATIEPSLHAPGLCWEVVFEDGSETPYSLAIDKRQTDRAMQPGRCRLTIWTQAGGKLLDLQCTVNVPV